MSIKIVKKENVYYVYKRKFLVSWKCIIFTTEKSTAIEYAKIINTKNLKIVKMTQADDTPLYVIKRKWLGIFWITLFTSEYCSSAADKNTTKERFESLITPPIFENINLYEGF